MNNSMLLTVDRPPERALIRVLLMAADLKRDLNDSLPGSINAATLVQNLSYQYRGRSARAMRQVAGLLADGTSVVDALEQTPNALNPSAVLAIRLAGETGTVPETMRSLIAEPASDQRPETFGLEGRFLQNVFGLVFAWLVIAFLMLFIIPTFKRMFDEFDIALPSPMVWLIEISDYGANLFWLLVLFVGAMFLVERRLVGKSIWRRRPRATLGSRKTELMALLAIVIRQERPLVSGMATIANYHPNAVIRSRLSMALVSIQHGTDPWAALREQRLIGPAEAEALLIAESSSSSSAADDSGADASTVPDHARLTQVWLLERSATRQRQHRSNRQSYWLQGISLASTVLLAVVVTFTAYAVFTSVYELVNSLA